MSELTAWNRRKKRGVVMWWLIRAAFSRLGALVMGALGVLGLWLWGRRQQEKRRQAEARADGLEAKAEHLEKVQDIDRETQRVKEALDADLEDADGLVDYFRDGKLLRRDTRGGPS